LTAQTERAPAEKPEPAPADKPEPAPAEKADPEGDEEYDPFEKFNERMFEVNRQLDRFVLKPIAQVYRVIVPEPFEVLIANVFDNAAFVPRAGNSLLQAKWGGTARELGRFLINSTLGIGGLFDAAKYWGIEKSREDFGQTLGFYGVKPGPFLIMPLMEPMTVRDGVGKAVDAAMDPLAVLGVTAMCASRPGPHLHPSRNGPIRATTLTPRPWYLTSACGSASRSSMPGYLVPRPADVVGLTPGVSSRPCVTYLRPDVPPGSAAGRHAPDESPSCFR